MSIFKKLIASVILVCLVAGCLCGCDTQSVTGATSETTATPTTDATDPSASQVPVPADPVDYAGSVELDMNSETLKQTVTVRTYVDGDTTHFHVPASVMDNGVLKARYLGINTPESTGKIEEYGKKASAFTKEKLSSATSIIIESDNSTWNADSTGERYLVWVWYRTSEDAVYRNLNIEILQNGLAIANSVGESRYADACTAAIEQARQQKLCVYSGQPDPDFYYGPAVELTLKELRTNIESYTDTTVAFNGIVTIDNSNTVYVEAYDAETDMYYGMPVYYGFNLSGTGLDILTVGNEVRIVGKVQYYEAGDSYQVSGLSYRMMKPDDPENIQKISDGHSAAYVLTDADTFVNGKVEIQTEETSATFDYAALALGSSLEMKGLKVKSIYTTTKEDSSSKGAMTLTCEVDGITVSVRTAVLLDDSGKLITEDAYLGKTIDVKGIVDCYDGDYQIKVFSADNINIIN